MTLEFINSNYGFSLYPNLLTVDKPLADIEINQMIEDIKYGYIKDIITTLRSPISKSEYNAIKKESIPCVTISGSFGRRAAAGLVNHSGLMQIDIDKLDDYDSTFIKLCKYCYIYVCFRSPGGKGIKAIVKITPSPETHKSQFKALEIYFNDNFNIVIDSLCKDVARSMLLSYDPDIFCNPYSKVFEEMFIVPESKKDASKRVSHQGTKSKIEYSAEDIDLIERLISTLERKHIDITSTYANWIKVGFALCTAFGEQGRSFYHRIGGMYPRYTLEETDNMFSNLLAKNNGKTKIGTIIYLAREAGVSDI